MIYLICLLLVICLPYFSKIIAAMIIAKNKMSNAKAESIAKMFMFEPFRQNK